MSDLVLRIAKDVKKVERPSLQHFVVPPELREIDESLQLLFHCSFSACVERKSDRPTRSTGSFGRGH